MNRHLNFFEKLLLKEKIRPKFDFPIKKEFKTMIENCWSEKPQERPTFEEIFNKLALIKNNDSEDDDHFSVKKFCLDDVDYDELFSYVESILHFSLIGDESFHSCLNLSSIKLPSSLKKIGSSAFYNCESLKSIEIPHSVSFIGNSAFYGCKSLVSIEIPTSVTKIECNTFAYCNIKDIKIPSSVTIIESEAFYYCSGKKN